jgi:hypothetical protein
MDWKRIEDLTAADIVSLVADGVSESRTLDFKAKLPDRSDGGKKEFLADVSSFANASGGHILYGVAEALDREGRKTAIAGSARGIAVNGDEQVQWMENLVRTGIAPRLPRVQFRSVPGFSDGDVMVAQIRRSWVGPHMVTLQGTSRFYSRNSSGKYPLDVGEIRSAFIGSEQAAERVRRFRFERLDTMGSGDAPVPLLDGPRVLVHLVPVGAFDGASPTSMLSLAEMKPWPHPLGRGGVDPRFNFDGVLQVDFDRRVGRALRYLQIFSSGSIETGGVLAGDRNWFSGQLIEGEIRQTVTDCFDWMRKWGIEGPYGLMLSLAGVKGYHLAGPENRAVRGIDAPIDRDLLIVPIIWVEDADADVAATLRPAFDAMWRASGFPSSPSYGVDGSWMGQ